MRLSREYRLKNDLLHINRVEAINASNASLTIGWQVRFQRKSGYLSKFFSDSVHGGKEESLAAARAYRNDILKERNEELGEVIAQRMFVLPQLPRNNTSGILGVNRSFHNEKSGNSYYVWQSTYNDLAGKTRNKSFRTHKYGEIGALINAINFRRDGIAAFANHADNPIVARNINEQVETYDRLVTFLSDAPQEEQEHISSYLARTDIAPSTKKRFVETRITQRLFRDSVLSAFGGKCAVTGASKLLIASHIKPWSVCSDAERIDCYNGLLLSPTYDKAFDLGLISFDHQGQIMVIDSFKQDATLLGISASALVTGYTAMHDRYMRFHRAHIYASAKTAA